MTLTELPTDDEIAALAQHIPTDDLVLRDTDTLYTEARFHREQAEYHHNRMLFHFLELGRRLTEIRRRTPHGEFIVTVQSEVGITDRHARRLMELSRNRTRVSDFEPDTSLRAALETIHTQRQQERQQQNRARAVPRVDYLPEGYSLEVASADDLPMGDGVVKLIVTSPPYGLGIDYADTDDNEGYNVYLEHTEAWSQEMFRVSAPNGRLCLNVPLDVTYGGTKPIYADWVESLQEAGWNYRTTIVWNENNVTRTTARGSDSANSPHVITRVEMVAVMFKGDWSLGRTRDGGDLGHDEWLAWTNGLWEFPGAHRDDHPAPFPEELADRCIRLFSYPGDVILDPFVGSGTTLVVARRRGRPGYGFDHSPQYIDQARMRMVQDHGG